jgi:hypothetical protein
MPEIMWTQALAGEQPDCILGKDRILLHYTAVGHEKSSVVCFDMRGRSVWSRPGWSVLLTLPCERFLLNTLDGMPIIVDGDGEVCHRWSGYGIERVRLHGSLLLMASRQQIYAVDLELSPMWQVNWPGSTSPPIDCFVDGLLFWIENGHVTGIGQNGRLETLWKLPDDLISEAMEQHEKATGNPALSGWYARFDDPLAKIKPFVMGDRPTFFYWRVSFDRDEGRFFLANGMGPHMIACLDRSGEPLWCKYLCFGCCGGLPFALGNGLYVASSGCGGILSWFDSDGNIIFQSEPQEGVGLATALFNEVTVLPNRKCLVGGGPGIVAFSPKGEQLWVFNHGYSVFHCNPGQELLAGCYWRRGEGSTPSQTFIEVSHGL